ncbi:MAG: cupin domain-containing protein [Pseudomonadota bacterium]
MGFFPIEKIIQFDDVPLYANTVPALGQSFCTCRLFDQSHSCIFSNAKKALTQPWVILHTLVMLKPEESIVDESSAQIGEALRARRKELGLTMQTVADKAGLSIGFISQVERNLTQPSLASLVSIANVLQTSIAAFLDQPRSTGLATHGDTREVYSVPGAEPSYERLSASFDGSKLHSVIIHVPPGHRAEPIRHFGEEMFYLISGEITVEIEGVREILRAGDTIHFDSGRTHSTWNHGADEAAILWCGTMDIFGEAPAPIHKTGSANWANTSDPTGPTGEENT